MKKIILILVAVLTFFASGIQAQTVVPDAEKEAIRQTVLDYIEGWYEGDAERLERALHPNLAKRRAVTNDKGQSRLDELSAMSMVQAARGGSGKKTPKEKQQKDITILDLFGNTASVKVVMTGWIDYMHLAKWNGKWVIVNVLWDLKPTLGIVQSVNPVKSELETLYARQDEAVKKNDYESFVGTFASDYTVKLLDGRTLNRAEVAEAIKNDMARTVSVAKSISTINELTTKENEAVVIIAHEAERVLSDGQGNPHKWENKVIHRETWAKTAEGWKIKSLEEIEQVYLRRDNIAMK
jgi:hypothetical protein